jgi:serine/threonine protein kinase
MTGFTGTLIYMAPEVALRQAYTEKVDIYSFGMILWQMTSGQCPFVGMYREEYMERVVKGGERPKIREDLPLPLIWLIERCWDRDPSIRPSCAEVLYILDTCVEWLDQRSLSIGRIGEQVMNMLGLGL